MSSATTLPGDARLPVYPLRVYRVQEGVRTILRTISDRYWGCWTHYKGFTWYCGGNNCRPEHHKLPMQWKGYAAVEIWDEDHHVWYPQVFEMTSHLELDFRGKWHRGQVWECTRALNVGKKHEPTYGVLLEERPPDTFPAAFDLYPPLRKIWQREDIKLNIDNPAPARTLMSTSKDAGPLKYAPEPEKPTTLTAEDRARLDAMQKRLADQRKNPAISGHAR